MKSIEIYSFNHAWNIENKVYAIQNIILPVPVAPKEVLYFAVTCVFVFITGIFIPLSHISPVLKYGIVPFVVSQFLRKFKLDGKAPHKYAAGIIVYFFNRGCYYENFAIHSEASEIKLEWYCSRGGIK